VLYETLEAKRFYVVFEPDIQNNLSRFAERWGEDYNRNQLEGIRAMVFCNGWYANSVGNADPDMLALCPLHLTLVQRQGATRILFVRPSVVAAGTAAEAVAREIEQAVGEAVRAAISVVAVARRRQPYTLIRKTVSRKLPDFCHSRTTICPLPDPHRYAPRANDINKSKG
jgi:hypothetical protein